MSRSTLLERIEVLEARKATTPDLRAISKHIRTDLESKPGAVKVVSIGITRPKRTSKAWKDAAKLAYDGTPVLASYPNTVMRRQFPEAYTDNYEVVALYARTKAPPRQPSIKGGSRKQSRSPKAAFIDEVGIEVGASRTQQADIDKRIRAAAFFKNKSCWQLASAALVLKFSGDATATVKNKLVPIVFKAGHRPCTLSGENIALDLISLNSNNSVWLLVLHGRRSSDANQWKSALQAKGVDVQHVKTVLW